MHRFPMLLATALAAGGLFLGIAPARAQFLTFGKNKVQYNTFEWLVLESEHFRLYYYEEEEQLARTALEMAEEGYDRLRRLFVHEVEDKVPLIIYSSHQDFEQTNVTPMILPEGVAGLTEFGRGRVLIPFGGSLSDFRTTIHHELVHVFQLSLEETLYEGKMRTALPGVPLWFTEGLAVHWSEERDTEADMVVRDMAITGRMPAIDDFWRYDGTFTLYKLGQSVLDYIGATYGEDRIRAIYDALAATTSFPAALHAALGVTQEELSERWMHAVRSLYYPDVVRAEPVSFDSRPLTEGPVDLSPVPVPAGVPGFEDTFLFLSPRLGYTDIYAASVRGLEKRVRTVVEGERGAQFESLHPFRARLDVNKRGELLFVSQRAGEDVIYVFSLAEDRIVDEMRSDDLVGLRGPAWSPDGRSFVFSGLSRAGQSDLYVFHRDARMLDRLTNDPYEDTDPAWDPNGRTIVFVSDRGPGEGLYRNLFLIPPLGGEIRFLTRGEWRDTSPSWTPDGREIVFASDRHGFISIWRTDLEGRGGIVLGSLEALTYPRVTEDGRRLLFTSFKGGRFRIGTADFPRREEDAAPLAMLSAEASRSWRWQPPRGPLQVREGRYRTKLSLEIANGAVAVDPGVRGGEGVQAMLADMMGNHLLFIQLANTTFSTNDFLRNFSAGVSYVNLSRRMNYGVSVFHFAGDYLDEFGMPYRDRRAGASTILIYPTSKFQRFEMANGLAYAETDRSSTNFRRTGMVAQHSVSWIRDSALWLATGPIDGHRSNVTLGLTMDLSKGRPESSVILADFRRYVRLGTRSAYAARVQGLVSSGPNERIWSLGGSLSLRGYDRRQFEGTRSILINHEVRFPLVQHFLFQLPMGGLEFPEIQGAVFADAGSAWYGNWPPPWKGSVGASARMGLGGLLVLRLDAARRHDFETFGRRTHWSFFIGWNY